MDKNEENRKKACLAVYLNGWKECEENWCDASSWCPFHPNYNEEDKK
ncbi:MAG: hypothetical protein ACFFAO_06400 [Candidatus Hermodarchaeota archaeon]